MSLGQKTDPPAKGPFYTEKSCLGTVLKISCEKPHQNFHTDTPYLSVIKLQKTQTTVNLVFDTLHSEIEFHHGGLDR